MRMLVLPAPFFAGSEPAAAGESIHDSDSVGKGLAVLSVFSSMPAQLFTSLLLCFTLAVRSPP
jgi:hypothetical protein